jgi:hypothetical protein
LLPRTLNTSYKEKGEEKSHTEKVEVIKLDDWVKKAFTKLDFIKIDVEGNEMKTLNGAKETIQKFQPTLMVEMEQRHHSTPIWNEIAEVASWGFDVKYLNRKNFTLEELTEEVLLKNSTNEKNKTEYINNIIFTLKPNKKTYEFSSKTGLQIFHYRVYWFFTGDSFGTFYFSK